MEPELASTRNTPSADDRMYKRNPWIVVYLGATQRTDSKEADIANFSE